MEVPTPPIWKTSTFLTFAPGAGFACPDLTTFCGLDELGPQAVGQRLEPDRVVLACRVVEPDDWRRCCGLRNGPADLRPRGSDEVRSVPAAAEVRDGHARLGATLQEVQGLLRHAHLRTTAIYIKVDKTRLTRLVPERPAAASGRWAR
jgi:hypothetical protein